MAYALSAIYCLYFFVTAAILFVFLALLCPLVSMFDRQRKVMHALTTMWGYHFIRLNPFWKCRFEGTDNLAAGHNYIIVANHQSLADVFLLAGLRHHFRWISKESLMRIPFFGWIMKLNGDIPIRRGDRKSIKEMMDGCKRVLNEKVSILMFPEGTRSEDGQIHDFKDGSFRLSIERNVPIVPVVISGTKEVLSKHSRVLNFSGNMTVRILPPVEPECFHGNVVLMRNFMHDLMTQTLDQMRQSR